MPNLTPRRLRRPALALCATAGLLLASAATASAHVTVSSPDAVPGGFGKLVVRVPTESDTASTTRVEVTLPADTPFAFVSAKPHPGWTVATSERALPKPITVEGFTLSKAVSTVTWTATDQAAGIAPGQFDEFELSVGPFPAGATGLSLPATQTYSDGTTVQWDQPVKDGADEPEHPVPSLELATSSSDGAGGAAPWLAGAALLVALVALAVASVSLRRRTPAPEGAAP